MEADAMKIGSNESKQAERYSWEKTVDKYLKETELIS